MSDAIDKQIREGRALVKAMTQEQAPSGQADISPAVIELARVVGQQWGSEIKKALSEAEQRGRDKAVSEIKAYTDRCRDDWQAYGQLSDFNRGCLEGMASCQELLKGTLPCSQ